MMENLSASHHDEIVIINRCLTVVKYNYGIIGAHGRVDSSLLSSLDSKKWPKTILSYQKYCM